MTAPKPKSLAQRLIDYLNARGEWVHGGKLEELAQQAGYKASNGSRRLRVLEEASRGLETTPEHVRAKELLNGARIVAEYREGKVGYRYEAPDTTVGLPRPRFIYRRVVKPDGTEVMQEIDAALVPSDARVAHDVAAMERYWNALPETP